MHDASGPLTLRLVPRKPHFLVGEGILVDIEHRVEEALAMETVELNAARTHIALIRVDMDEAPPRLLNGADYARLHRAGRLTPIGTTFEAPAGSTWTSTLELFHYTRALPAGRYRLWLRYRYDATNEVRTNEVAFEVVPARVLTVAYRWFGGRRGHEELASVWGAQHEGRVYWFYQVAGGHDPGAVVVSTLLEGADLAAMSAARLAHLNDIAGLHFERYVVWLEGEAVGSLPVQLRGLAGEASRVRHGLLVTPAPRLLDPPLQLRSGGVAVVLVGYGAGGVPSVSLVRVEATGRGQAAVWALPGVGEGPAVVVWDAEEEPVGGWLYQARATAGSVTVGRVRLSDGASWQEQGLGPGAVEAVSVDQWLGAGAVAVLVRQVTGLRLWRWGLGEQGSPSWGDDYGSLREGRVVSMSLQEGGATASVLVESEGTWSLRTALSREALSLAGGEGDPVAVVLTPREGSFVVFRAGERVGLQVEGPL